MTTFIITSILTLFNLVFLIACIAIHREILKNTSVIHQYLKDYFNHFKELCQNETKQN